MPGASSTTMDATPDMPGETIGRAGGPTHAVAPTHGPCTANLFLRTAFCSAIPALSQCDPWASQCDPGLFALRPQTFRTARLVGSHCEASRFALRNFFLALRPRALRSATPNSSQCEARRFALRRKTLRTAKNLTRTAKILAVRGQDFAVRTKFLALRSVDPSQCDRTLRTAASSATRGPRSATPNFSQCEAKIFALRRQDFRSAKHGPSHCEVPDFALLRAVRPSGPSSANPGVRTAPSSATPWVGATA